MFFCFLFEFSDFRCEGLKIVLEARICLLYLYPVVRQTWRFSDEALVPWSDNGGTGGAFDCFFDDDDDMKDGNP